MSNISQLLFACARQRTTASIIGQQSKIPLLFARNLSAGEPKNKVVAMPKRWSQKHERILYNTVTTEYLESNKEIDWALVSSRVRTFNKDLCKARFYQLQRQLADRTSSKNAIWSRPEIEKLVAGAHMADMARLKSNDSKAHINWTTIANQFSNKRSPDECKRIYHNYRHLCKVSTGWEKYRPKVWLFCTTVALVFVVYVYGELVDILYYYIEGEESADL